MRLPALAGLVLASCLGGGEMQKENARLSRQVEDLRRRVDGDRRTVHELENRVFILEDKLDTAQVEQGRAGAVPTPRLPVVTKAPAPEPREPEHEPEPEAPPPDDGAPAVVIKMDGRTRQPVRLDSRDLDAVDEKLPVAPLPRGGPPPATPARDAAMDEYQRAYAALGRREHAVAIAGLRAFVAAHPQHEYADNAQYWLGEAYYDQADYATALVEFRAVLKRYPGGNKAPDALLKIGFCLTKLGDAGAASDVLGQVVEIYPKTDAAKLAMKRLDEIRRAR